MTVTLLEGHVVDVLAGLPAGHFHCAVTSPPYLWLRAYGTEGQVWPSPDRRLCSSYEAGGRCVWGEPEERRIEVGSKRSPTMINADGAKHKPVEALLTGAWCLRCGAWRGELGQEPSPELYVEHLVAVFRAVKRVLRQDGTLWVNLAGCYYNDPGGQNGGADDITNGTQGSTLTGGKGELRSLSRISLKAVEANRALGRRKRGRHPWLKPLDWVDVPGMFARAMQQDGWCWRSDVTWVKPSALPESVSGTRWERCRTKVANGDRYLPSDAGRAHPHLAQGETLNDPAAGAEWADCPGCPKCAPDGLVLRRGSGRPSKSTERILLFTKGPGYFYDTEAVRERTPDVPYTVKADTKLEPLTGSHGTAGQDGNGMRLPAVYNNPAGRNLRDAWIISPEPLRDQHYAAYPSALPERCILAGTSEWGCCPSCGAPWARVVDFLRFDRTHDRIYPGTHGNNPTGKVPGSNTRGHPDPMPKTLGWRPTCRCAGVAEQAPVPARVLDPFSGSGTTLLAANRLGRDATGVELKPAYNDLARKRVGREPLSLFAWQGQEAMAPAGEASAPLEGTKQEQHPTRTVGRLPPLVEAPDGAGGVRGAQEAPR